MPVWGKALSESNYTRLLHQFWITLAISNVAHFRKLIQPYEVTGLACVCLVGLSVFPKVLGVSLGVPVCLLDVSWVLLGAPVVTWVA